MARPARKRTRRPRRKYLPWLVVIGAAGLIALGVSQMSSIAYTDADIGVVDFSVLSAPQKRNALEAANKARCTCGCGMTVAQCVATDSTCPIREENIRSIRTMVREAHKP